MLDVARDIIGSQPILTAFLAIGLGYLVGQISIGGFSLGVGAVLFVGLALGAFAPKAQITGPIGLTGIQTPMSPGYWYNSGANYSAAFGVTSSNKGGNPSSKSGPAGGGSPSTTFLALIPSVVTP